MVHDNSPNGKPPTDSAADDQRRRVADGKACAAKALDYRRRGWSVLALCPPDHVGVRRAAAGHAELCETPGKRPWHTWKEYQDRPPTEEEIRGWWRQLPNSNVGVALGPVSGIVRVDVDGPAGEARLRELSGGDLPDTLEFVGDASKGGRGLLYAIPGGVEIRTTNQTPKKGEELRFQAKGAQSVLPPSRHPSGALYAWKPGHGPDEIGAAPMPPWLIRAMAPARNAAAAPDDDGRDLEIRADAEPPADKLGRLLNDSRAAREAFERRREQPDPSASGQDFTLALAAAGAEWSAQEIVDLLLHCRARNGEDQLLRNPAYYRHTVGKAIAAAGGRGDHPREAEDDPHRLARLYLADHTTAEGSVLRWWRDEFHRWNDGCYRPVADKEVKAELAGRVKREFDDRNREALRSWTGDGKPGPPVARKVTTRLVADVIQALQGTVLLPGAVEAPAWLDADAPFPAGEVLVCRNGLVHLPGWAAGADFMRPLTPRLFTLNALDYAFDPRAPTPRAWLEFLERLWEADRQAVDALQEWFGYILVPDTRHHKILMIVGPKRSGKGTIARVLRALIGVENTASPTLASLGLNFGLAPLLGKTLAVISDARLSGRTDAAVVVERLLSISGEDAQTIDRKFKTPVTTTLPVRFMILTNELPRLSDPSGALAGRLVVLRQTRSWYGKEDVTLTGRLLAELPGILLWAMEGWKRLRERGRFVQPESAEQMVQDLEDLSSPIGAFLREECEVGPGFEVPVKSMFAAWKTWCEVKGQKDHGTEQSFGRDLRAAVPGLDDRRPRTDDGRVRVYAGVRLRPFDDPRNGD